MGILESFLGGGGSDPYDLYGDLFTDRQKAAMREQQQGQGLLRMAAALGQAAMPSRMPVPIGAVLGSAAGALGTGQDAAMEQMLKAAQTAEAVRQSKQTQALMLKIFPYAERLAAGGTPGGPAAAPAAPAAPGPGPAPAAAAAPAEAPTTVDMPYPGRTPYGMPQPPDNTRWGMPRRASLEGPLAAPDAAALAQLAAGGPDQVIGQGQGLIPRLAAGYGGDANAPLPFGQGDSGTPTVRLASAALAPYAIGNAVMGGPSSVEGVGDALSQRFLDMAKAMPPELRDRLRIISGERTPERQIEVYRGSDRPPPMNSRHITGDALDLAKDPEVLNWINQNPQYGVGFPLAADPREINHLEMLTANGARIGGSARRGGRFAGMGPNVGGDSGGQESSLAALSALTSLLGLGGGASGLPDLSALLRLTGGFGGSGGAVAPSFGGGSGVLDSVIAPLESGNRNIMQQVVDPSVSTAGGFYQITNSTWRDTAPKAGVDLSKYPTAISAPRDVQKQVAQQLLDTRGVQPWADFNPAVAAATGYRRGGRFAGMGPAAGGGGSDISSLVQLMSGPGGASDLSSLVQLMSGPGGLSTPPSQMFGGEGPTPAAASAGEDQETPATLPVAARGGPVTQVVPPGQAQPAGRYTEDDYPYPFAGNAARPGFQQGLSPEEYRQRYGDAGGPGSGGGAAPAPPPAAAPAPAAAMAGPLATPPAVGPLATPAGAGAALATPPAIGAALATPPQGGGVIPGTGMTPQQIAGLNAMMAMVKLGTPFQSLLETYYKSPQYLGEAATATKGAELQQELLLKPKIEAAIAWAKIDPNLSEAERKAQIDRYSKQLELMTQAQYGTQEAPVYGPDGQTILTQKMTQLELSQKRADQAARVARGDTTPRPGDIAGTPYYRPGQAEQETNEAKARLETQGLPADPRMLPRGPGTTEPIVTPQGSVIPPASEQAPLRGGTAYQLERLKSFAKTEDDWTSGIRSNQAAEQRALVIANTMKQYQTGTFAQNLSEIRGALKAAGVSVPDSVMGDPAQMQIILKNNFGAVLEQLKNFSARPSQLEVQLASQNWANPGLQPEANLEIIGQTVGSLRWERQLLADWREAKKNGWQDPQDFMAAWSQRPENSPQKFVDQAIKEIGPLKGMPQPVPSAQAAAARKEAADLIAKGLPRDAILKRLRDNGIDAGGL